MRTAANEVAKLDRYLASLTLDPYTKTRAQQLRHAMALMPMTEVLAQVRPGDDIKTKCEHVGVSRNTWYGWSRGEVRPTKRQAQKLEELTGIAAERFQGQR
jgi:hypothetical protein